MNKKLFYFFLYLTLTVITNSCTYDEGATSTSVTIKLSRPIGVATVEMTNNMGLTFHTDTDVNGNTIISLAPGIYSAAVSKNEDNGYIRSVYNGNKSDIVVTGESMEIIIDITESTVTLNNPILIKEIYVGGCQKDDGSGWFAIDKSIILYNNSSEASSLDNVAIGIVEPYNAEATLHAFLNDGALDYENEDWIPVINGIWYFQDGNFIPPYSELVVNVYGCIDNTQTYSQSVNYANPDYFCMYDVEATSSDGGKYNNTAYYPSPSEFIPYSHCLKAVKYGQANVWPISMLSPAIILFKTLDISPHDYGNNPENLIYPNDKQGNLTYACLKLPRNWILDAVEVFNAEKISASKKRLTPDIDGGYVETTSKHSHSVVRRVEITVNGHQIYQDTNNSSNDFYEAERFSLI